MGVTSGHHTKQAWASISLPVSTPRASCAFTGATSAGPTRLVLLFKAKLDGLGCLVVSSAISSHVSRLHFLQHYKKAHSVSSMKANPLGGACMAKGIVLEKV